MKKGFIRSLIFSIAILRGGTALNSSICYCMENNNWERDRVVQELHTAQKNILFNISQLVDYRVNLNNDSGLRDGIDRCINQVKQCYTNIFPYDSLDCRKQIQEGKNGVAICKHTIAAFTAMQYDEKAIMLIQNIKNLFEALSANN